MHILLSGLQYYARISLKNFQNPPDFARRDKTYIIDMYLCSSILDVCFLGKTTTIYEYFFK